jgi:hypothetical protein
LGGVVHEVPSQPSSELTRGTLTCAASAAKLRLPGLGHSHNQYYGTQLSLCSCWIFPKVQSSLGWNFVIGPGDRIVDAMSIR